MYTQTCVFLCWSCKVPFAHPCQWDTARWNDNYYHKQQLSILVTTPVLYSACCSDTHPQARCGNTDNKTNSQKRKNKTDQGNTWGKCRCTAGDHHKWCAQSLATRCVNTALPLHLPQAVHCSSKNKTMKRLTTLATWQQQQQQQQQQQTFLFSQYFHPN